MKLKRTSILYGLVLILTTGITFAQNPIITNIMAADLAVLVYQDTVFLDTGHEEAPIGVNDYIMHDWHTPSSTDMVQWTDRGACLSVKDFS